MNVSSVDAQDLLVHAYLSAVADAAADLPAVHRDELLTDLREHIVVARSQHEPTEAGVRTILERLGHPLAIVDAARGFVTGTSDAWAATGGWASAEEWPGMRGWAGTQAWPGTQGWPRAARAMGGAAPATVPDGSFAAIWHRSPLAVAVLVIAALCALVLLVGFFAVAGSAPEIATGVSS